jgi:hypothetical protein
MVVKQQTIFSRKRVSGWDGVSGVSKKKTLLLRTREGEQLGYEKRSCRTRQESETDEEDAGEGGREKRRDTATTMIADAPVQARCAREREETEREKETGKSRRIPNPCTVP